MGQVLHGCATTTAAVRRAIQHSQESLRSLVKRYGIDPKTVAKWKKRAGVDDLKTGPKEPRSTSLSAEEEAIIVAFRRHTLLPLDDSSTPCRRRFRGSPGHRFTVASSGARSAVYRRWRATRPSRPDSSPTRSATSTSTSPR
jgi:transposase-like protein